MPMRSGSAAGRVVTAVIYGIARIAVAAARLPFGIAVPPVIGAKNDVPGAGKPIHIIHVPLGSAVLVGRDVAVIEDDDRPTRRRRLTPGNG
ncbi:MAG TPA: hypothetical protein PLK31_21335 [Chloroflexota bacterium]|nr:hypothetical protein [Chloroflexota bacterium]